MSGKKGLIMGVANERSIAWGIAKAAREAGAELAFTYQGDALRKRVEPLAKELDALVVGHCDVSDAASIDACFKTIEDEWGKLDFLVHAIGFSDKNELRGKYVDTSLDNFLMTMNISAYSLVSMAKAAEPLMEGRNGTILALSYYGSVKVVKSYNVMGVAKAALEASVRYLAADLGPSGTRVNAISAGPIKTLSAMGVSGFSDILKGIEERSPMRRNVTQEDVGNSAAYLLSPMSTGVTGQIIYVDSGLSILGV